MKCFSRSNAVQATWVQCPVLTTQCTWSTGDQLDATNIHCSDVSDDSHPYIPYNTSTPLRHCNLPAYSKTHVFHVSFISRILRPWWCCKNKRLRIFKISCYFSVILSPANKKRENYECQNNVTDGIAKIEGFTEHDVSCAILWYFINIHVYLLKFSQSSNQAFCLVFCSCLNWVLVLCVCLFIWELVL